MVDMIFSFGELGFQEFETWRYLTTMRKYYFDPSKHKTYLEQLGVTYPTIRNSADNKAQ
jgi:metal-dependent amidase/aminoacylase/carboxypeptidase family protein